MCSRSIVAPYLSEGSCGKRYVVIMVGSHVRGLGESILSVIVAGASVRMDCALEVLILF